MIDRAHSERKAEDFKVKLGLILGSRFDKVTCNRDHIVVEHQTLSATVNTERRCVIECQDTVLKSLIDEVLTNIEEVDAPALVNFIK
jgi:hypothetical protein